MTFEKLIKDKRVIFVCPAPYLLNQNNGEYFDKFDTVVRTNGAILMRREFEKDYGSRTDILYVNVQFMRDTYPLKLTKKPQWVCLKAPNGRFIEQMKKQNVPWRSFQPSIKNLHKKVEGLLSGTAVVHDILKYNPKQLHIVGMSFYDNKPPVFVAKDWREYYPGYLPKVIEDIANVKNKGRRDPHNYKDNARWVYEALQKNRNLTIDDYCMKRIENLLKIK